MSHATETIEIPSIPEDKPRRYVITAGKGLGVLLSVALTAYISVQEAISDRPTRANVKADITEVKDHEAIKHKETSNSIKALDEEIDSIEDVVISTNGKVDALDKKVSEGFAEIKEELRYLRRKK